jgi:predicted P-loop ATPase
MAQDYDFAGLAERLLGQVDTLLPMWLPGGKVAGNEYICAGLTGGAGKKFSVNRKTGVWKDFSGGDGGRDLVGLYAAINGLNQGKAFRELADGAGFVQQAGWVAPPPKPEPLPEVGAPPSEDLLNFEFLHPRHGKPVARWTYRDETGAPLMVVARYETEQGKQVLPWTWLLAEAKWTCRGWGWPSTKVQRPLYGLEKLPDAPGRQVLVVEGEKKADAAQRIVGEKLVVIAWSGGAQSIHRADWSPLVGRSVVLWPDADLKTLPDGLLRPYLAQPGPKAMQAIAGILEVQGNAVKVLDVGLDSARPDGWDAADALVDGWDWDRFIAWAKPRLHVWPWAGPVEAPPVKALPPSPEKPRPVEVEIMPPRAMADPEEAEGRFPASMLSVWERLQLSCLKSGDPHVNLDNVFRVLTNDKLLKDYLWYDEFHEKCFTQFDLNAFQKMPKAREWNDGDELILLNYLQRHVGLTKLQLHTVSQGVALYSQRHVRNEPKEWLTGLKWDGVKRLENLLSTGFGTEVSNYASTLSKNWIMSMCARVMRPGCQVDTMPVLVGEQGVRKSTSLEALASPWFAELSQKIDTLEFYRALRGKMMVEIAELASFKMNQIEEIKKMLTTKQDHYRGMYGKNTEAHARRTVFVGTTNVFNFLADETGARRFWPVFCKHANPVWIKEHRDQMFAEALTLFKHWETTRMDADGWWMMPVDELREKHEQFRDSDEWEDTVVAYVSSLIPGSEITIADIALNAIGLTLQKVDRLVQMRIGKVLRHRGYVNSVITEDGKSRRIWLKADKSASK